MFAGDFDVFMGDFGEQVLLAGLPVRAVFEVPTAQALDVYGTAPMITIPSTHKLQPAVAATDLFFGPAQEPFFGPAHDPFFAPSALSVIVRGVTYTIIGVEPDGTGMTRARLERA